MTEHIYSALSIYLWVVVYSFYHEIKEGGGNNPA